MLSEITVGDVVVAICGIATLYVWVAWWRLRRTLREAIAKLDQMVETLRAQRIKQESDDGRDASTTTKTDGV